MEGKEQSWVKHPRSLIYAILFFEPAQIESRNDEATAYAFNELNEHPFDVKHTFLVNRNSFTDIDNFADLCETSGEPPREEYHTKVRCWLFPETVWIDEVIEQFEEVVESY